MAQHHEEQGSFYSVTTGDGTRTLWVMDKELVHDENLGRKRYRGVVELEGERRFVYSQDDRSYVGMMFWVGEPVPTSVE